MLYYSKSLRQIFTELPIKFLPFNLFVHIYIPLLFLVVSNKVILSLSPSKKQLVHIRKEA